MRNADLVACSSGLASHILERAPGVAHREWQYPTELPPTREADVAALRAELGIPLDAAVVVYTGTFEDYHRRS